MASSQPIVPSFVVQEQGSRHVFIYLNIPELRVKRKFPNILNVIPSNVQQRRLDFGDQSLAFSMNVQTRQNETKVYSLLVRRLPSEINVARCSIKYQRGGCWIKLFKVEPTNWMNRISNDLTPGLDTLDEDNEPPTPSAPVQERQLKDTAMPPPYSTVPIAPNPPARPSSKKSPAPRINQK